MSAADWFATRYAVRLPNGELLKNAMGSVWTWDTTAEAEHALSYFEAHTKQLGVDDWRAEIVHQLCTPWLGEHDTADHMIAELTRWLEAQTGGSQ